MELLCIDVVGAISFYLNVCDRYHWKLVNRYFAKHISVGPIDKRKVRVRQLRYYNPLVELCKLVPIKFADSMYNNINMTYDDFKKDVKHRVLMGRNPNITMEMIIEDIKENPYRADRYYVGDIVQNDNFDPSIIDYIPHTKILYAYLSESNKITYDIVKKLGLHQNWDHASLNKRLPFADLEKDLFPFGLKGIGLNPGLTIEFFDKYKHQLDVADIADANVPFELKLEFYLAEPAKYAIYLSRVPMDIMCKYIDILAPYTDSYSDVTEEFVTKYMHLLTYNCLRKLITDPNIRISFIKPIVKNRFGPYIYDDYIYLRSTLTFAEYIDNLDIKWHINYDTKYMTISELFVIAKSSNEKYISYKSILKRKDVTLDIIENNPKLLAADWSGNPNLTPEFIAKHLGSREFDFSDNTFGTK